MCLPFFLSDDEEIGKQEDVHSLLVYLSTECQARVDVAPHQSLHFALFDEPTRGGHNGYALDFREVELIGDDEHFVNALCLARAFVALLNNLRKV